MGTYQRKHLLFMMRKSVRPTMNVMHRILEHYFIQLCGDDSAAMSMKVLEAVKKNMDEESSGMVPDYTKSRIRLSTVLGPRNRLHMEGEQA